MRIVLSLVYRWRLERPPALIIHGLCAWTWKILRLRESVVYLEPNLNPASLHTATCRCFPPGYAVVGFTFYPGYKSEKKPGCEYHTQGLGLICVMGTRQKLTWNIRMTTTLTWFHQVTASLVTKKTRK
jgi:hypothetical protein